MTPAALIFLDFDGVLHPGLAGTFIYLPELEAFLRSHPKVVVVLSTTWRLQYSVGEIQTWFSADTRTRIIGATPSLGDGEDRYAEIQLWLARHNMQCPWVALDDEPKLFPPSCPELVLCATARGLRRAQLTEMLDKLGLWPGHEKPPG